MSSETPNSHQQEKPKDAPEGVVFARSLDQIQQLYEGRNILSGQAPQKPKEEAKDPNPSEPQSKVVMHLIPSKFFQGFEQLDEQSEKLFEFVAFFVTLNVADKMTDDCWALEFPTCIGSQGRQILHEVANYFKLAHHSQGKDKNRRTFIYPRTQFGERQETERRRLEKEKEKLWDKYKDKNLHVAPNDNPKTFRDQVLRQIWEDRNNFPVETRLTTNMLDELTQGIKQTSEDFI